MSERVEVDDTLCRQCGIRRRFHPDGEHPAPSSPPSPRGLAERLREMADGFQEDCIPEFPGICALLREAADVLADQELLAKRLADAESEVRRLRSALAERGEDTALFAEQKAIMRERIAFVAGAEYGNNYRYAAEPYDESNKRYPDAARLAVSDPPTEG